MLFEEIEQIFENEYGDAVAMEEALGCALDLLETLQRELDEKKRTIQALEDKLAWSYG